MALESVDMRLAPEPMPDRGISGVECIPSSLVEWPTSPNALLHPLASGRRSTFAQ